jgi:hypothetical protein
MYIYAFTARFMSTASLYDVCCLSHYSLLLYCLIRTACMSEKVMHVLFWNAGHIVNIRAGRGLILSYIVELRKKKKMNSHKFPLENIATQNIFKFTKYWQKVDTLSGMFNNFLTLLS